ncbi:CoA transferase [Mycolicibacterium murale]|uniref:CoA transferase n=1 Tax=Mycolicibacterium murale TaxID=182220 RepID=A0A7I9WIZ6_9MYCO|nr:CoA transferase [Mycolicibacterium murale]GFG57701.1 CoA transferase [Mycolicibacterium murale]
MSSATRETPHDGALTGVTVLDLTTVVMGPFATSMLGDFGAEVIKVEALDGDITRRMGPQRNSGMTALTLGLQRNKRSIAMDLKTTEGRDILARLVRDVDIVVCNLRPQSRERLGLTYSELTAIRPDVILCTAQAYAQDSTRRNEPAYDDMVQAASGLTGLAEAVDGTPRYAPYVIADKVSGLYIVIAILTALYHRAATGAGQHVEVPMVDAMIHFNLVEHLSGQTFSPPVGDFGWSRVLVAERAPYRTADGYVCILPYTDANWRDFFALTGLTDLLTDPKFTDVDNRHQNMGYLHAVIGEITPHKSTQQWLDLCRDRNVPASGLLDLAQVTDDPYVTEQGVLQRRTHPTEGDYFSALTPIRLSESPVGLQRHAPVLGAHTAEVLTELGYTEEDISRLSDTAVVMTK